MDSWNEIRSAAERAVRQSRFDDAGKLWVQAAALCSDLDRYDGRRIVTLEGLASVYWHTGKFADALPILETTFAIHEEQLGPDHADIGVLANNLARLYHTLARLPEGEQMYKRALRIQRKAMGVEHPDVAELIKNYANLLVAAGKAFEAEDLKASTVSIKSGMWNRSGYFKTIEIDSQDSLFAQNELSAPSVNQAPVNQSSTPSVNQGLANQSSAPSWNQAPTNQSSAPSGNQAPTNQSSAPAANQPSANQFSAQSVNQSQANQSSSPSPLPIQPASQPSPGGYPSSPAAQPGAGNHQPTFSQPPQSAPAASNGWSETPTDNPSFGSTPFDFMPPRTTSLPNSEAFELGALLANDPSSNQQTPAKQESPPKQVAEVNADTAQELDSQPSTISDAEKSAESNDLSAWLSARKVAPAKAAAEEKPEQWIELFHKAMNAMQQNNTLQAEQLLKKAVTATDKFDPTDARTASTLELYSEALWKNGKLSEAEPVCERTLYIYSTSLEPDHQDIGVVANNLAMLYHAMDKPEKAEPLYKRSLAIRSKNQGASHPDVVTLLNNYANMLYVWHREGEAVNLKNHIRSLSSGKWNQVGKFKALNPADLAQTREEQSQTMSKYMPSMQQALLPSKETEVSAVFESKVFESEADSAHGVFTGTSKSADTKPNATTDSSKAGFFTGTSTNSSDGGFFTGTSTNSSDGGFFTGNPTNSSDGGFFTGNSANSSDGGVFTGNPSNSNDAGFFKGNPTNSSDGGFFTGNPTNSSDGGFFTGNPTNSGDGGFFTGNPANSSDGGFFTGNPANQGTKEFDSTSAARSESRVYTGTGTGLSTETGTAQDASKKAEETSEPVPEVEQKNSTADALTRFSASENSGNYNNDPRAVLKNLVNDFRKKPNE